MGWLKILKAFLGRWLARFFFPRVGPPALRFANTSSGWYVGLGDCPNCNWGFNPLTIPGEYRHVGILHHVQNMGFHGVLLTIQAVIPPFSLYPMAGIDLQETRSCLSSW